MRCSIGCISENALSSATFISEKPHIIIFTDHFEMVPQLVLMGGCSDLCVFLVFISGFHRTFLYDNYKYVLILEDKFKR